MSRSTELSKSAAELIRAGFCITIMHAPTGDGSCTCGHANCRSIGKHPRQAKWSRSPLKDIKSFHRELAQWPHSNIAVVTGNGVIALDIDPRHGGEQSLANLERRFGHLPRCPTVSSGGGGQHRYFSASAEVRSRIIAPGLELKAAGACLVAPPSSHPSGGRYRWLAPLTSAADLPRAPDWLARSDTSAGAAMSELRSTGFVQGARNNGMTRLAGCLIGKNVPLRLVTSLLEAFDAQFNQPPLGTNEVHTIITSIAMRELRRRRS